MSDIPMLEPIAVWSQPSTAAATITSPPPPPTTAPSDATAGAAALPPAVVTAARHAASMDWEGSGSHPPAASVAAAAPAAPAAAAIAPRTAAAGPSTPRAPVASVRPTPSKTHRSATSSYAAMYEVVDLVDEDSESDSEAGEGRGGSGAGGAAHRMGAFSGVAVAGAPAVERFTIDLDAGLRAVSGRALRRQRYPQAYPSTPPPEPEPEPEPPAAAPAAAASGDSNGNKKSRRKRKKRSAVQDYYNVDDPFIDDSELFDDGDMWGGQEQQDSATATGASAVVVQHAMTAAQLQELLSRFAATSAAALLDDEELDESDLRSHVLQPKKKVKKMSKFVSPEKGDGDKEKEKEAQRDKPTKSNKGDKTAAGAAASQSGKKRKEDGERKKEKAAKELGSGGGAAGKGKGKDGTEKKKERSKRPALTTPAVAVGEAGSSAAPIVLSGWGESDELPTPSAPAATDAPMPQSPALTPVAAPTSAAAASAAAPASPPSPPPPPADIGKLHRDWLQCFDRFPATPAVVSLLEAILAEGNPPQQATHSASTAASTGAAGTASAVSAPPPQPSSPNRQSSVQSAATNDDDSAMTDVAPAGEPAAADGADGVSSSQLAASSSAAAAAAAASATPTRTGLRHKPNASLAALTRQPHKLPDSMSKLLTRLGALLETQVGDESAVAVDEDGDSIPVDKDATVNKFASMLARELVWTRGTIKQRLTVGRLEGQLDRYLTERFHLYERLRDRVREDVQQQTEAAGAAAAAHSHSTSWYKPNWPSYMRLLLDFATYTDDLTEALEELEQWAPKRAAREASTTDAEAKADVIQARIGVLTAAWAALPIPASSYSPAHLPLLTSITETLYASLPLLWAQEQEGRPALMDEETIERTIDQAEKQYVQEQEDKARQQRQAEADEAARIEGERLAQEAAAEAAAKAEADRKAAVELLRKKEKAAARAAATAAAAAAAVAAAAAAAGVAGAAAPSAVEGESKEAPSLAPVAVGGGGSESVKKEKVRRRPKAEVRGEGDKREKQCFGPLCARPAADGGADDEGTWHLLKDFSPSVGGAGGVLSRCRPCENLIRKKAKAAAAAAAAATATATATPGGAGAASSGVAAPNLLPRLPSLPVCSATFALVPPPELRWKVPSTTTPRMQTQSQAPSAPVASPSSASTVTDMQAASGAPAAAQKS